MSTASTYPVELELNAPVEVANWLPLVAWLLAIPHLIVLYFLNLAFAVLSFIAWFAILFTGTIPDGIFNFMAMVHRYQWRVTTYTYFMRDTYPAFDFTLEADDPGTDPAEYTIEYPEHLSRGLIFIKWLLAFPHYIVLIFLELAAFVAGAIAFFAVLFTGRWPAGLRAFIVGVFRWATRVQAYVGLMTDVYPPFSLQP